MLLVVMEWCAQLPRGWNFIAGTRRSIYLPSKINRITVRSDGTIFRGNDEVLGAFGGSFFHDSLSCFTILRSKWLATDNPDTIAHIAKAVNEWVLRKPLVRFSVGPGVFQDANLVSSGLCVKTIS